jgi:polysaccharide export outer membrane protein
MWLEKVTAGVAVLLTATFLAGCQTDGNSAAEGTPSAAPWWKGSPATSNTQPSSSGIAPSFSSTAQGANNRVSPKQNTAAVHDPNAAQAVDALASVTTPGQTGYRIGPQDVLQISVFQAPDLSKTVEVADNGTIDFPLIGETPAAGKTAHELQRDLGSRLGAKYLQNPQVQVMVKEFNSNRVTVSGAVKSPGVFPYKGESLFQCITLAGGLAQESNSMILVLRTTNGQRSAAKFNLEQIQTGRVEDPKMQAGDVIVADTSVMKKGLNNIMRFLPLAGFAAML